jgi:hypothetical protein
MPRNVIQPERFLLLSEDLSITAAPERESQGKTIRSRRRRRRAASGRSTHQMSPPPDFMMRTRRLIMAALRVWELKHDIHEPF